MELLRFIRSFLRIILKDYYVLLKEDICEHLTCICQLWILSLEGPSSDVNLLLNLDTFRESHPRMLLASSLRLLVGQQSLSQVVRGLEQGLRGLEQGLRGLATAGDHSSLIPKRPLNPWISFYDSKLPEYR